MKHYLLILVLVIGPLNARIVLGQDWIPRRIVGMDYPALAAQSRTEGMVKLKCVLDSQGRVTSTTILEVISAQKPAEGLLGQAARENAAKWKFMLRNEGPITASSDKSVTLIYNFKLEGATFNRRRVDFAYEYPNAVFVTSEAPYTSHGPIGERKP